MHYRYLVVVVVGVVVETGGRGIGMGQRVFASSGAAATNLWMWPR